MIHSSVSRSLLFLCFAAQALTVFNLFTTSSTRRSFSTFIQFRATNLNPTTLSSSFTPTMSFFPITLIIIESIVMSTMISKPKGSQINKKCFFFCSNNAMQLSNTISISIVTITNKDAVTISISKSVNQNEHVNVEQDKATLQLNVERFHAFDRRNQRRNDRLKN